MAVADVRRAAEAPPLPPGRDALTGALDPPAFLEQAALLQGRAQRLRRPLALALVDVDGLGEINTRHGWAAGDACLAAVAAILIDRRRLVCRWGGDVFAVLLHDRDRLLAADELRVCAATLRDDLLIGRDTITISAGVTDLDPAGVLSREVARARRLLDRARAMGRGRVVDGRRDE